MPPGRNRACGFGATARCVKANSSASRCSIGAIDFRGSAIAKSLAAPIWQVHRRSHELPENHSCLAGYLGVLLRDSASGIGKVQGRIGVAGFKPCEQ
jgi:hypothetical protein